MASSTVLQLLLCLCLVAFGSSSSITTTNQLTQATFAPTNDVRVVSSYDSIFSTLAKTQPFHRGPWGKKSPGIQCIPCYSCDDGCDGQMFARVQTPNTQLAAAALRPASAKENQDSVAVSSAPTMITEPESFTASKLALYTAQAHPSRTTIYQALPTQSTLPDRASTNDILASGELEHQSDLEKADPTDITRDYYTNVLDGRASSIMAVLVQDNQGTPVTLLSHAKTIFTFNLISADLVEQLNLTHRINRSWSLSTVDPYNDLEIMSGRIAAISGVLSLDVVAGRYDAQISDVKFLVFKPVTDANLIQPEAQGKLQPDIYAGVDLLYRAGALTLSDDFIGVAPKNGLGIVVQKVFDSITTSKEQVKKETFHDEL